MTATAANADVFTVSDSVRGLTDVQPGDRLILRDDGDIYLQRAIGEEMFTELGLSGALIELKYRGSQPEGHLAAVIGAAAGKLRKLMDEALHPTLTPRGPQRRTGRERRVRNIEGTAERRAETGDVEMTDVLRHRGDGSPSHLPQIA